MKLYVNDIEIPVVWENSDTVAQLKNDVAKEDIIVEMSMYSDNEQVGSLEKSYKTNDEWITTYNGDVVLYDSNKIVVFYESNSWNYTRLGKINLSKKEVKDLFAKENITLSLRRNDK